MLEFDAATTKLLDTAYQGSDFAKRRRASFDVVDPLPGDRILDLGCGPGLLTLELARAVGPKGLVFGLDPSPDMRATAVKRCEDEPVVQIIDGSAQDIPFEDESLDKAVAVQVFEYFDNLEDPLKELRRVLRPGGRVVISDMHFGTWVWHSADSDRMERMMKIWDLHLADREVPEKLPALLKDNGFQNACTIPLTLFDTVLRPDGMARMLMILMSGYAQKNGQLPDAEIAAWLSEQESLAAEGRFFMAITHFITYAERI
jgi:arsenite methyltransferase